MKSEAQNQQDLFFFRANDQVAVRLEEQFKVHPEIIETENYVSESFIIHHYQILNQWNHHNDATKKGELWMRDFEVRTEDDLKLSVSGIADFFRDDLAIMAKEDDEDEDWDEDDDEEWDDDDDADEDEWDEDEEDWDEDDEDWDEDEEDDEDFEEDEE